MEKTYKFKEMDMAKVNFEIPQLVEGVETIAVIDGKEYVFRLVAIHDVKKNAGKSEEIEDKDEMSVLDFNAGSVFDEEDEADEFSEKVQHLLKDTNL